MKQLSEELNYLKNRSLLIVNFMLNKSNDNFMIRQYREIIEKTYEKNDLKGLRTIARDTNAWAKGIPKRDIQELEELLILKFGENLSGDRRTHQVIEKILKSGSITNDDEYRVIHEYLNDISKGDPYFDRIDELRELLENR